MAVNRGFGLTLGIGEESSWGTPASRTNWKHLSSTTLERVTDWQMVPHLGYSGQASTMRRRKFAASRTGEGQIVTPMCYNDSTILLLKHIFGAVATTGGGPYDHTLTLASPGQTGLTLEVIRGSGPADNLTQVYEGCRLDNAVISISAGEIAQLSADVIAEDGAALGSAGSPSYNSSPSYVQHNHMGTLTWNGQNLAVRSLNMRITRGLSRNQELGSLLTSEPYEDMLTVELEATALWQSNALDAGHLAGTESDVSFTLTGPGNNAMAFTAHNAFVRSTSKPTQSASAIEQTITWAALADGSDQGFTVVATNDNANAEDN